MIRFILADRFGFSWESIKRLPAHFVKQYIRDIEKSKSHFKGLNKGDAKKFAIAAQAAGIPAG
jgi:chloramphenicol O-acetyltransferase